MVAKRRERPPDERSSLNKSPEMRNKLCWKIRDLDSSLESTTSQQVTVGPQLLLFESRFQGFVA